MTKSTTSFAPGRVCLFGEHHELLGLEAVSMTIPLGIRAELTPNSSSAFCIELRDPGRTATMDLDGSPASGGHPRLAAAVRVLREAGVEFSAGADIVIGGDLPMQSGLGFSSALLCAFMNVLLSHASQGPKNLNEPRRLAELVHRAERLVDGRLSRSLDPLCCSFAGLNHLSFTATPFVLPIPVHLAEFVLIETAEPVDRQGPFLEHFTRAQKLLSRLQQEDRELDPARVSFEQIYTLLLKLKIQKAEELWSVLYQRDLTQAALRVLGEEPFNQQRFGELLNEDHMRLRSSLGGSTARNDEIRDLALSLGAAGVKQASAGNGGALIAYAPDRSRQLIEALQQQNLQCTLVEPPPPAST